MAQASDLAGIRCSLRTACTVSAFRAKAMPSAPSRMATAMPISSPLMFSDGPPIARVDAGVGLDQVVSCTPPGIAISRPRALTMPVDTVFV